MIKYDSCSHCEDGYLYVEDASGNIEVKKCRCLLVYLKNRGMEIKLQKANIPVSDLILRYDIDKDYIGNKSLDSVEKVSIFLNEFYNIFYNKCLYFYGGSGTQKTTIAYYILRELITNKFSVYYTTMDNMIRKLIKVDFDDIQDTTLFTERMYAVDCLVIDESFDKDKVNWYKSNYQFSFLDAFLRKRIEHDRKCTILISNKDISSIEENFGENMFSLISRNTYGCRLEFKDHYSYMNDKEVENLWSK
jgi:DNA replication protein DnaC